MNSREPIIQFARNMTSLAEQIHALAVTIIKFTNSKFALTWLTKDERAGGNHPSHAISAEIVDIVARDLCSVWIFGDRSGKPTDSDFRRIVQYATGEFGRYDDIIASLSAYVNMPSQASSMRERLELATARVDCLCTNLRGCMEFDSRYRARIKQ